MVQILMKHTVQRYCWIEQKHYAKTNLRNVQKLYSRLNAVIHLTGCVRTISIITQSTLLRPYSSHVRQHIWRHRSSTVTSQNRQQQSKTLTAKIKMIHVLTFVWNNCSISAHRRSLARAFSAIHVYCLSVNCHVQNKTCCSTDVDVMVLIHYIQRK